MYLLNGKLTAKKGHSEELASILIEASQLVAKAKGCHIYLISKDNQQNTDDVHITEVWDTKEDHDNSLKDDNVRNLIMKAMPLLEGQPTKGQELEVIGGMGIK
ncbi:putative quinol monooxygenase [Marinigracilibium pacificum]|uniref:Antibiotic biosynthesis monooxygenase n=1 Tax=Marinigracilibium pacificum TaxID=2729599 RepID=A0A848IZK6_9BACT|nr:antibiotic biosynthesis monooxygenase family protein [Marinigracilibium pacificum]NMM47654.1 antibiotic biosynthesis monooxygenase [Marinigracilibium pacificum]